MAKNHNKSRQGQQGSGQPTGETVEANNADLRNTQAVQQELQKFSMLTVHQAEAEIRKFKPVHLELQNRDGGFDKYTVKKLRWQHFDEGLQNFVEVAGPFLNKEKNVDNPQDLTDALGKAPEFVLFMAQHSCDLEADQLEALRQDNFDNAITLALAGMSVSFINNAAVRSFFVTAATVSQSVALEQQSAVRTVQP